MNPLLENCGEAADPPEEIGEWPDVLPGPDWGAHLPADHHWEQDQGIWHVQARGGSKGRVLSPTEVICYPW